MRILRKAGSYGAVLLLCFLLTGFFGGEKPTEAVTAVITALENNDDAAFGQRVTTDYWLSAFTALDKSGMKSMSEASRTAFAELLSAQQSFMGAVELTKRSGDSMQGLARVMQASAGKAVGEGNFANLCRRIALPAFPFDPEMLKKAQVSEAGSGAAQNTATITCTMPDGQQGALGMVQIDGKWRIVSFGGNKKAAETQAVATLDALQKKAARLKERAPRAEAYKAQALDRHEKLGRIKEKKDREAATAYLAKTLPCKEAPRIALNGPLTLDSPELWDAVRQSMAQCLQNPEEPPSAEKWLENAHTLGPFTKYPVSEWLSETGNIALVRSPSYDNDYFPSDFAKYKDKDDDFFRQRWEKWIAGDYEDVQDYTSYVFQEKRAGVWSPTGVRSSTSIDLKNNQTTHTYYGIARSAKLPFTAEEFMTALAPRFPKLLAEARAVAAKAAEARAQELRERAQRADDFAAIGRGLLEDIARIKEKKDLDAAMPYFDLLYLSKKTPIMAPGKPITLDSPELWDAVRQGMAQRLQEPSKTSPKNWQEASGHLEDIIKYLKYMLGEVFLKTEDVLLTRHPSYEDETYFSRDAKRNEDENFHRKRRDLWLAGDFDKKQKEEGICLWRKQNGRWIPTELCGSTQERSDNEIRHEYPGIADDTKLPFTAEEFMKALAPRFPKLLTEARTQAEKGIQAEKERIAKVLEGIKGETVLPLAQELEKRTPAVLDRMNLYGVLESLAPKDKPIALPDLTDKVDALGAGRHALTQAVQTGKSMPGLEDLWNIGALRAATLEFSEDPAKESPMVIATIKGAGGPRYMGFAKPRTHWLLVTPPMADKTVVAQKMLHMSLMYKNQPQAFVTQDEQLKLRILTALLRRKQGEEFLKHVDLPSVTYWNAKEYSPDTKAQAKAMIFPEDVNKDREYILKNINERGVCPLWSDLSVDAESIENAKYTVHKGTLVVHTAPRPLVFLRDRGGAPLLVYTGGNLDEYRLENLPERHAKYLADVAKEKEPMLKQFASRSCADAALDGIVFKNVVYTMQQDGNGFTLNVNADIVNTLNVPVTLRGLELLVWSGGKDIRSSESFSIKELPLQPQRPARAQWSTRLDDTQVFWMYHAKNMRKEKAAVHFTVRPYRLQAGKLDIRRNDANLAVAQQSGGTWELGDFPPVRPALPLLRPTGREEQEKMKAVMQGFWTDQKSKAAAEVQGLFKKVAVTYDAATDSFTITNSLPNPITEWKVDYDVLENGVAVGNGHRGLSRDIPPGQTLNTKAHTKLKPGQTLDVRLAQLRYAGVYISSEHLPLVRGIVPPLVYQDSPVLFTMTGEQASGKGTAPQPEAAKGDTAQADTVKAETTKTEAPTAEPAKTEAAKAPAPVPTPVPAPAASPAPAATPAPATVTPAAPATADTTVAAPAATPSVTSAQTPSTTPPVATATPVAPAGKTPGKAVAVTGTQDMVGLTAFAPDGKPDSVLRVMAHHSSPLVAVRIDNVGGVMASWKTKDVKTAAQGVLAVLKDGKPCNPGDASFALDVSSPTALDLLVQDTGAIAGNKTRLRVVFFHKDGSRSYAFMEAAAQ